MTRPARSQLAAVLIGIAAALAASCGRILGPISAFLGNSRVAIDGVIVDPDGKQLSGVRASKKAERLVYLDAERDEQESIEDESIVGPRFSFDWRQVHAARLTFRKDGYFDEQLDLFPIHGPLRCNDVKVTLNPSREEAKLSFLAFTLGYKRKFNRVIAMPLDPDTRFRVSGDLDWRRASVPPTDVPAGSIYFEVQPLTVADRYDIVLRIAGEGAGLSLAPTGDLPAPELQVIEAPASGYGREVKFSITRDVSQRYLFFFFKVAGRYGKGVVTELEGNDWIGDEDAEAAFPSGWIYLRTIVGLAKPGERYLFTGRNWCDPLDELACTGLFGYSALDESCRPLFGGQIRTP
ncbi:MAG: hypothetical protein U0X73_05955 [Thermoanaerobaculia bacterium]